MIFELQPVIQVKAASPSSHPSLDVALSTLPALIAAIGGLFAAFKYLRDARHTRDKEEAGREEAARSAAVESRKPFLAKQQDVYFELVRTTAILGNHYANTDEWKGAFTRFWELYWGEIPVVADPEVGAAVDDFADTLAVIEPLDGLAVRNASMNLGRACRESLARGWMTDLDTGARPERGDGALDFVLEG